MTSSAHVHKELAKVAKAAANELYEVAMGDNLLRSTWKKQNPGRTERELRTRFVAKNWGKCIPFARATLAQLLTTPLDEEAKERIMEILVLDSTLIRGRKSPMQIVGPAPLPK